MSAHSSSYVSTPASTASSLPSLSSFTTSFDGLSGAQIASSIVVLCVTLLLAEQSYWRWRKGSLPGNKWQIPIIGQFMESLHPSMEAYMRSWAKPLATVSVFNIFIVIASTTDYSRKILNASTYTEPCLVRSAKQILLPENWVFLNGKIHNEYRKGLNVLFTPQALSIYLKVQDRIYRSAFKRWVADPDPKPKPYWMLFRDLNMETSLRVFCGEYIAQENVSEISAKYWQITKALELVNFPFAFPGTKVWHACRARAVAVKHLTNAAAAAKARMATGAEANCLLDAWVESMILTKKFEDGQGERPKVMVREHGNHEMALVLLSFIFASQDAMSSALTYGFQNLADHPEVLAKVRAEQAEVRGDDTTSALTLETLEQMPYINAVVREVLRHRPPVVMVPYKTLKPFPITPEYTVPTGTMLIPSFWNSLHDEETFPDADSFIPERWLPGGANEDLSASAAKWLVFGAGAHKCIGSAAMLMDWEHERGPDSDEIQIVATLFPKDGCRLKFSARDATKA